MVSVSGRSRSPSPAQSMTAFMKRLHIAENVLARNVGDELQRYIS